MSKKIFTKEEIEILSNNKYVKNVTSKGITYTDEFKRIFISQNDKGKLPREIFTEHGFDVDIIGVHRVKSSGKRWRSAYRTDGISGLQDTRKYSSGRPSTKELSLQEKYEKLEAQNKLLQAENELLKKIDMLERGLKIKK